MVILSVWGIGVATLLLNGFLSMPISESPGYALVLFLGAVVSLLALSMATWIWLRRRWHWGKIVILWAWGVSAACLFFTSSLSTPDDAGLLLLGALMILLALSVATWVWLCPRWD